MLKVENTEQCRALPAPESQPSDMCWMLVLHLMHCQPQAALPHSLALGGFQEASVLFSTIEDFMWFKVALVRPPRPDAGPGSSHGMSMLAQGRVGRPLC